MGYYSYVELWHVALDYPHVRLDPFPICPLTETNQVRDCIFLEKCLRRIVILGYSLTPDSLMIDAFWQILSTRTKTRSPSQR